MVYDKGYNSGTAKWKRCIGKNVEQRVRVKKTKAKVNKWDLIKLTIDKETTEKMKRQCIELESYLQMLMTDKGLISKIQKQLPEKKSNLIKN